MKRYLLTAGSHYYPEQGSKNWIKDFDTYSEVLKQIKDNDDPERLTDSYHNGYIIYDKIYDWYDIVDTESWR